MRLICEACHSDRRAEWQAVTFGRSVGEAGSMLARQAVITLPYPAEIDMYYPSTPASVVGAERSGATGAYLASGATSMIEEQRLNPGKLYDLDLKWIGDLWSH